MEEAIVCVNLSFWDLVTPGKNVLTLKNLAELVISKPRFSSLLSVVAEIYKTRVYTPHREN